MREFVTDADAYERGRASYPAAAVEHLAGALDLGPGRTVVDLGAGTGKMTRLLAATGADVVAVEPMEAMRRHLPGAVDGTAEAIPLVDGAADAVVAAQAFHWFRPLPALAEIARVLRPGGGLALVWNHRDAREPWVAALLHASRWDTSAPYERHADWGGIVESSGLFGPVTMTAFEHRERTGVEGVLAGVASISHVAAMGDDERAALLADCRRVLDGLPPTFEFPYVTECWTAAALPRR